MPKQYYQRNLPHWQPTNGVFNICFRLNLTLPKEKWLLLQQAKEQTLKKLQATIHEETLLKAAIKKEQDLYFGKYDALLDAGDSGPTFLKQHKIAAIVADCLLYWQEKQRYKLICYAIMPNHVHVILYKIQKPLYRILQTIKIFTAKEANILLGRTGQTFWHPESYDNLVRNRDELQIKVQYILQNAVKAKLVRHWAEFKFVYLHPDFLHYAP